MRFYSWRKISRNFEVVTLIKLYKEMCLLFIILGLLPTIVVMQGPASNLTYMCAVPEGCITSITQKYLTDYGYLNPDKTCEKEDMEAALRKFQEFNINLHDLQVTGYCDDKTLSVMSLPRCGCEDIVKFEKKMMPQSLIGPQEYNTGTSKWHKRTLTWKVVRYPSKNSHLGKDGVDDAMKRALDIWSKETKLQFQQEFSTTAADINISFGTRRHEEFPPYYDFDGPGNVLAHAFFPESGLVHFDDDEKFNLNSNIGTELFIVAAHEFGHTLGISHSNIQEALMAPYYRYSPALKLHVDDISAIQSIYGLPSEPSMPPIPRPTEQPVKPKKCNFEIDASFKMENSSVYIFVKEPYGRSLKTFVYQVSANGIDLTSKKRIDDLFVSRTRPTTRAYPNTVDAAEYVPKQGTFLFSGTRTYRYTYANGLFDLTNGYPRWMDVSEFPERPRAAVAMPYSSGTSYYMLIFGSTMVWDWNFSSGRVGAWAYPINSFGRNMPQLINSAYFDGKENVIFQKQDDLYKFSIKYRRIESNQRQSLTKDFLKNCT